MGSLMNAGRHKISLDFTNGIRVIPKRLNNLMLIYYFNLFWISNDQFPPLVVFGVLYR
jgi:hypothetical protein